MSMAEWLKNGYIAVSRAFGALKVVASRTELERDPKLMRISSLQKASIY